MAAAAAADRPGEPPAPAPVRVAVVAADGSVTSRRALHAAKSLVSGKKERRNE